MYILSLGASQIPYIRFTYTIIRSKKCLPWGTSLRGVGSPVLRMLDNKKLSSNEFKSSGFLLAVNLAILSDNERR